MLLHLVKFHPCKLLVRIVAAIVKAVTIQMMDNVRRAHIPIVPIEDEVFVLPLDEIKQGRACWGVSCEQGEQGFKVFVEFHLKDFLSCV